MRRNMAVYTAALIAFWWAGAVKQAKNAKKAKEIELTDRHSVI